MMLQISEDILQGPQAINVACRMLHVASVKIAALLFIKLYTIICELSYFCVNSDDLQTLTFTQSLTVAEKVHVHKTVCQNKRYTTVERDPNILSRPLG